MFRIGRYWLWRLARITFGLALLITGIFLSLPGVPGPGIVLVVLSLGILSADFGWAARLRQRFERLWQAALKKKPGQLTERGPHG